MFCGKCGKEIPDGASFCPACGGAIQLLPGESDGQPALSGEQPPSKSRTAYILLAFFLGGLGIHNFYAKRTGCGVAQLLITVLSCGILAGISGLWALIEMLTVSRDGRGVPMYGCGVRLAVILIIVWLLGGILAGISAIGAAMLLPALNQARERSRTISCTSNMKQIGVALTMYALDYKNQFPSQDNVRGLEMLRSLGYLDYHCFVCPSSGTIPGSGDEPLTEANCDYLYLGGLVIRDGPQGTPDCPVVIERPKVHSGNLVNVLYLDGHVGAVQLPDTVQTVADLLEYLAGQTANPQEKEFLRLKKQMLH